MKLEFNDEELNEIREMADRKGKSVEQFAKEAILGRIMDIYEAEFIEAQRKEFMRKNKTDGKTFGEGEHW